MKEDRDVVYNLKKKKNQFVNGSGLPSHGSHSAQARIHLISR